MDTILGEDMDTGVVIIGHLEILMDVEEISATFMFLCLMVDKCCSCLLYIMMISGTQYSVMNNNLWSVIAKLDRPRLFLSSLTV